MGREAKVVVRLSMEERILLDGLVAAPRTAKDKALRARILLKADADGPNWVDARIAEAFEVAPLTVARLRRRCVFEGLEAALSRRPTTTVRPPKLDGAAEARLVALACGPAPEGRAHWTMRLLADRLVELEVVDAVSDETVRLVLKKTSCSRGGSRRG